MDVDTIVSLSTPPGVGAIAVVRLSGPDSKSVLRRLSLSRSTEVAVRHPTLVELRDPDDGSVLDRALVTRYDAPESYTGEDMVELSCHGGWLAPSLVVDACQRCGAREAEPGEFTRRAYLRGKLDLVQAEAIADLIEARSRAFHRAAIAQLDRGLSARVSAMRERLVRVEALLAHHVDFPEEDDAPVPIAHVSAEAEAFVADIDAMLATAPEGEMLREGALAVFAGRPNAGKSSLYNALLGQERAIVTPQPGTTRDAIESVVQIGGFPFRLVDTAGLRSSTDRIERLGIEVTRRYVDAADVILLCVPADEAVSDADREFVREVRSAPVVWLRTKADVVAGSGVGRSESGGSEAGETVSGEPEHARSEGIGAGTAGATSPGHPFEEADPAVHVSAETGEGLDRLRTALTERVYSTLVTGRPEMPVLTRSRHARALRRARDEVSSFREGLEAGLPAEVAATHLRSAETALEELLGVVSVDDVLDVVFREFCVGK